LHDTVYWIYVDVYIVCMHKMCSKTIDLSVVSLCFSDVHTTNAISNLNTMKSVVDFEHRQRLSGEIVESLDKKRTSTEKSIIVFGSGNMNDINWTLIAPHVDAIHLVDVRPEFTIRSLIVNYWDHPYIISKSSVHYVDVTKLSNEKDDFMEIATEALNKALGGVTNIQDFGLCTP
jgi:hypothetical protein